MLHRREWPGQVVLRRPLTEEGPAMIVSVREGCTRQSLGRVHA